MQNTYQYFRMVVGHLRFELVDGVHEERDALVHHLNVCTEG